MTSKTPRRQAENPFAARRRSVGREPTVRQGSRQHFRSGQTRRASAEGCPSGSSTGSPSRYPPRRAKPRPERSSTARSESTARSVLTRRVRNPGHARRVVRLKAASKGNKAQGGQAVAHPNTVRAGTDLLAEQGPEGRQSLRNRQQRRGWQRQRRDGRGWSVRQVREGNGRGDTVRLREGKVLRGVRNTVRESRDRGDRHRTDQRWSSRRGRQPPGSTAETHRTPRLAAGCNKPASPPPPGTVAGRPTRVGRSAERTGETVRNGEVGARTGRQPGSEAVATLRESGRRG